PLLVLADADLRPLRRAEDASGHLDVPGRDDGLSLAADEQDRGCEGRPVVLVQAVDEQPLALTDAVLLPGNLDDRVGHGVLQRKGRRHTSRGPVPASRSMIADVRPETPLRSASCPFGSRSPRSIRTSARTPPAPASLRCRSTPRPKTPPAGRSPAA